MRKSQWSRREFVDFFGRSAFALSAFGGGAWRALGAGTGASLPFEPLLPSTDDALRLAKGFAPQILIRQGETFGKGVAFGDCNDYIAFVPLDRARPDEGLLWINHEDVTTLFVSGYDGKGAKTKAQVDVERENVGGSIVRVRREGRTWRVVADDPMNRRLSATTPIPFAGGVAVEGKTVATGTLANCAGGTTPWGTILTCEENFQTFYGDTNPRSRNKSNRVYGKYHHGWDYFYDVAPEHYGWVVEVEPLTGKAQKLTALGRFSHEGATVVEAPDGRAVVYMGDDTEDEFLYKFVAAKKGSLVEGELFVGDTDHGLWLSLDRGKNPALAAAFKDQLELLTQTRRAARLVGATPLNRPEDVKQDPVSKAMIVALTNNKSKGDMFGSFLKIEEEGKNPLAQRFTASRLMAGGPEAGFACPDNMVFDGRNNMWFTVDISGSAVGKDEYAPFGNNGLYFLPMSGPHAGKAHLVGTAPKDAEFTGPCFSPDFKQLFLSIQHPGEYSESLGKLTSQWPDGGGKAPRSAVVVLSGEVLEALATPTS